MSRKNYDALRDWLNDFMPMTPIDKKSINFLNKKDREKRLKQKVEEFVVKAKLPLKWRKELSDRLLIDDSDIVKATNTIIEMIEKELMAGHRVRIANFGDFLTRNRKESGFDTKNATFQPIESWLREINAPLYQEEIGLKFKLVKKKLVRRI